MSDNPKPVDPDNEDAPFGHNDDGSVLAPYGFKVNGKPRITNRGRQGGTSTGTTRKTTTAKKSTSTRSQEQHDQQRKAALLQLSDTFISTPLAAFSTSSLIAKRLGEKQADALAGDAVIWNHYAPALADGLIMYSAQKPGVLSWLDGVQEKAPLLFLAHVGVQMGKAIVGNHMEPNGDIANAGRRLARLNVAKMAQAINEEAEAMGIPTDEELIRQQQQESARDSAQDAAA